MARYTFQERERPRVTNIPLTYDIIEAGTGFDAGTLTKEKNRWKLAWCGVRATFATKLELIRHMHLLGHQVEGLV